MAVWSKKSRTLVGQAREDLLLHVVQQIALAAGQRLEERRAILALLQGEGRQVQAGDPALGPAHQPPHLLFRERRGEHLAEILARLDLLEAEIVRADLGQLSAHPPPRKRQVRVHPAGEDQMHVSGQMLQEEAHALVNGRVFDHLIIIQNEHDGGGMRRRGFPVPGATP